MSAICQIVRLIASQNSQIEAVEIFLKCCEEGEQQQQKVTGDFVKIFQSVLDRICTEDDTKRAAAVEFLEKYLSFISSLPANKARDKLLREVCEAVLRVQQQLKNNNQCEKELIYPGAVALAFLVKFDLLNFSAVVQILTQQQGECAEMIATMTLAKIVELTDKKVQLNVSDNQRKIIQTIFQSQTQKDGDLVQKIQIIRQGLNFPLIKPFLKPLKTLTSQLPQAYDPQTNVTQVAYNPISHTLITGGYDCRILYWDASTYDKNNDCRIQREIELDEQQIVSLSWCSDSQLLFGCTRPTGSAFQGPTFFAYNGYGQQVFSHNSQSEAMYVCRPISGTGKFATSETVMSQGKKYYVVKVHDVERMGTGSLSKNPPEKVLIGHTKRISDVQFDENDENIALTTSFDRRAMLWDLRTAQAETQLGMQRSHGSKTFSDRSHRSFVHSGDLFFSSSKQTILTAGNDFHLKVWDRRQCFTPLVSYNLDDSAVINVRLNKLGGLVPEGSMCVASTMEKFFVIKLEKERDELAYTEVEQQEKSATRDFVWVNKDYQQLVYSSQNSGIVAAYQVREVV